MQAVEMNSSIQNYGLYKVCPVCGNQFYIPPYADIVRWAYKTKGSSRPVPICSYKCSQEHKKNFVDKRIKNGRCIK